MITSMDFLDSSGVAHLTFDLWKIPQLDGTDSRDEKDQVEMNIEDEEDLRIVNVDEEERSEEDEKNKDESGDILCIHEVKIDTSKFRPECKKCCKNYYKIMSSECPHSQKSLCHYRTVENCYDCSREIDGWIYKT